MGEQDHVVVFDVSAQDGHLGGHDVTIYDLAGLVAADTNDLRHLLASKVPVVALEPSGRSDLSEGAVKLGVAGVVTMEVTPALLVGALQRAAAGDAHDIDETSIDRRAEIMAEHELTWRELQILELIATGQGNQQIADQLYLSINSVKTFIRKAYRKIGATSRSQAVLWASSRGLNSPDHRDSH